MSRTKRSSGSQSPVKRYLSFAGNKGQIKFYDKEHDDADSKGNVYLKDIDLIVLDIKASVSGYNEKSSSGISSNLLDPYSTGKEEFIIKTKQDGKYGEVLRGIWKDIKLEADSFGGKYTTNIFALADVGDGLELVKMELNGSGLTPWIEYTKALENSEELYDKLIKISKGQLCARKKGKTAPVSDAEYKKVLAELKKDPMADKPVWFYTPLITDEDLTEEQVELAIANDEILQAYFDETGNNKGQETDDDDDDTPEAPKASKSPTPAAGTEEEDDDDLPF
jgi:hypothetical protein